MADCVVPQEYGTTIAEKRSVGVKICHGLLEKIKYDLNVARSDNEVDMRYLINLAYKSDLNINSMGRRIRTRLYFTSESHLHTVLSVLRFSSTEDTTTLLSENGLRIISSTPELCYLTQIVMRVFEDARREMDDPRRFRVEILFSPGANATPFHMHEQQRDQDTTRFDTAPLQMIGREGLTCKDVEDFLEKAMMAGESEEQAEVDVSLTANPVESFLDPANPATKEREVPQANEEEKQPKLENASPNEAIENENGITNPEPEQTPATSQPEKVDGKEERGINEEDERSIVDRKYYWNAVAVGSFVLGVSCLLMALSLSDDSRARRRWTRRY
jgi:hypothetical protein